MVHSVLRIALCGIGLTAHSTLAYVANDVDKTVRTDGTQSDVTAALNVAAVTTGWTVLVPAGSYSWTGFTINKAVHLQGAGAGRVIGRSTSTVAVGTGPKTFTTQTSLPIYVGQRLRVERTGTPVAGGDATGVRTYLIGTVTSYSDTTLVLNVTSTGGGGSHSVWIISTMAATTITHNGGGSALLNLTENIGGSVRVSGLRFVTGSASNDYIQINRGSGGKPVLIYDCFFDSVANLDCIQSSSNQGVVWNCSFAAFPFSREQLAIHLKNDQATDAWTSASTMGMADISGTNNFYIEDCNFHAWLNCTDFDDNAKVVMRHCVFNNAGVGTHGADTSPIGVRHYEIYNSEFVFNGFSNGQTMPLNWWFFLRGGTGVIASNIMPDISSGDYGNKLEVSMTVMNLQRAGGPNPCYKDGYPCPRQVGMGRVTGTAANDTVTYRGDSEPLYIWGNTGGYSVGWTDYGECGSGAATSAQYIQLGRDVINNGTAKPGWVAYTYPHPLRLIGNHLSNQRPVIVAKATPTNGAAPLTVMFSSMGSFDPEGVGLTYHWAFGDGTTASTASPTTTFQTSGVYSTRLTVSDGINTTSISNLHITVTAP